jgi:hypothetical protein
MTKGKPWSVDEINKLKEFFNAGITDPTVLCGKFEGKFSRQAVRQKLFALGLKEKHQAEKNRGCFSSNLVLPDELFSVEEALKVLAGALNALTVGGLDKTEIIRLRSIIQGAEAYIDRVAQFVNYRGLEFELLEWRRKFGELGKKGSDVSSS